MNATGLFRSRAARGLATSVAIVATASWTISCNSGVTDTPRAASIALEPEAVVVSVGALAPLTAVVADASGNSIALPVVWSSSDTNVARVSAAGVVTARAIGDATIAATSQGVSATAIVTVSPQSVASVRITPTAASVRVGGTARLSAEALSASGDVLSDRSIVWSSSNANVASVDASGVVTGKVPGAVTITATSEGRTGSAAVTVTLFPVASLSVTPTADTLRQGQTRQMTATARDEAGGVLAGRIISWSSGQAQVATVSSSGLVTAVTPGKTTVVASTEGISGTAEIVVLARPVATVAVSPTSSNVHVGSTVPLGVTLRDSEGSVLTGRTVAWSSGKTSVATVSAAGIVTAVAAGEATVTATSEGRTGSASIVVTAIPVATVDISPSTTTVLTGRTTTLVATPRSSSGAALNDRVVTWSSGVSGIATVTGSGVVTGVSPGNTLIFAEVDGVTNSATVTVQRPAVVKVDVTPTTPTIGVLGTRQMTATARDSDNNALEGRAVSWLSSDDATVFVTSNGLAIGLRKGTATISATIEGVSGSTIVTVN